MQPLGARKIPSVSFASNPGPGERGNKILTVSSIVENIKRAC